MLCSASRLFLFLVSFVFLFPEGHAQEWTRFRGPNGSGIGDISGLPDKIRKGDYDWTIKLDGVGHSSPVLWGKKIFITLVTKDKKQRHVKCFDSESGKLLWDWLFPLAPHNLHKYNNLASSTPTVDKDRLYLVWGTGGNTQAVALSHEGKMEWLREWPEFSSDHGFASSPVLIGGKLIFHTDALNLKKSYVIAVNPETGESFWELERTTAANEKHITSYNTPISIQSGGRETVVSLQSNDGWKGLDPQSGKVVWSFKENYKFRNVGSFAAADGILFATFGAGGKGKDSIALRMNGTTKPDRLYKLGIKDGLSYVPTPLIYKGKLFIWGDGGILSCREATTGKEIYRERVGGNFFSSPVIADGKIYCASRNGELVCVAAEGPFRVLGRSRLESGVNATPAIANNTFFIRTDTHLIAVKGRSSK